MSLAALYTLVPRLADVSWGRETKIMLEAEERDIKVNLPLDRKKNERMVNRSGRRAETRNLEKGQCRGLHVLMQSRFALLSRRGCRRKSCLRNKNLNLASTQEEPNMKNNIDTHLNDLTRPGENRQAVLRHPVNKNQRIEPIPTLRLQNQTP